MGYLITIQTNFSKEIYFCECASDANIKAAFDNKLASYGFCDQYDIIDIKPVDADYIQEREKLINRAGALLENNFFMPELVTNEQLKSEL